MTGAAEGALLHPILAMALLTFVVGFVMYRRRFAEIRRKRVRVQSIATSAGMATALEDTAAADNFRNLFEMPVLFYAALVVAYVAKLAHPGLVALAWAYVATRVVHSAIHCTSNRVKYRFLAFVTSFWLLAAMWAWIAWGLLVAGRG
jgi:hypothetical protein